MSASFVAVCFLCFRGGLQLFDFLHGRLEVHFDRAGVCGVQDAEFLVFAFGLGERVAVRDLAGVRKDVSLAELEKKTFSDDRMSRMRASNSSK